MSFAVEDQSGFGSARGKMVIKRLGTTLVATISLWLILNTHIQAQELSLSSTNVLKCWQCVVFKGLPTRCPEDAVLYELTGWNACMTWRLANGTTILQNFVQQETDCTEASKARWRSRIFDIWQMDGNVDCCTEDECNNEGRLSSQLPVSNDDANDLANIIPNRFANQINKIILQSTANQRNLTHFMEESQIQGIIQLSCAQCSRIPNSVCGPQFLTPSQRPNSQSSTPVIDNQVRMDFKSMVNTMGASSSNQEACRCLDGFIPIRRNNQLEQCHDPIVLTAVIGSRCLISQHCSIMNHTYCRDDEELQIATGISSYKTCQCIDGFQINDKGQCEPSEEVQPLLNNSCATDDDCFGIVNAACRLVSLSSQIQELVRVTQDRLQTFIGSCQCMEGYIPITNRLTGRLERCRDPIVRTSTVHGICITQSHCQSLLNTECRSIRGSRIKTCQCQMGFTELIEDLETGIISACTRRVGASETTQFVFQDDPMSPQDDAPLVSQGDSNQSELDIDGIMAQLQFPSGILGSFSDSQNDPVDYESQSQDNVAHEDYYTDLTDESTTLSPVTNTLRPLGSTTTSISQTANSGCSKKMTVVERNEWIPDWVAPLRLDSVTGVRMYVFYAKLPITAQEEDGLLVRLMSRGRLGRNAYFIKILKNRDVSIGRSFLDSESIETENVRVTESSTSVRWLSSQEYIGFWALHVNGYTSVGVIDAHFPDKPLVSWQDEDPFSGIDTIGLSAIGSAAFYELDCDFIFSSPGGICAQNQDCDNLANTDCLNERIDRDVVIRTCQCRSGNIQIPDIQRSFVGGCFDPIGQTKTLNGMCLADLHCSGLAYSYCLKLNQSATQGLCVCNPGFVPMERSNENGLILGCRPRSAGDSRVELENCAMNLTLLERQDWIPMNLLPFRASEESNEFKDYFYIRFAESSGSIASIKLLNQRQDPTKFYKITITDGNRISLFENLQSSTFLFEARNEQIIRNSTLFTPPPATFLGFWTLYRANSGLLEAGIIGQSLPVVTWTDRASDRMQDISWIGFETERGGPIEFASNC